MSFQYLLGKIRNAEFQDEPFRHIEINGFFSEAHLQQILSAPQITLPPQTSDEGMFAILFATGYKIIDFPGCSTDKDVYLKWHKQKNVVRDVTNSACEGFGITTRLMSPGSSFIAELSGFLNSSEFQLTLAEKFGIEMGEVFYDSGIQKYLDGYEISPHPDIRKKALTYMVNINPGADSEAREHHTHYLKFRDDYKYVQSYWEGRPGEDRCWVPWDWCDTVKLQRANNSIVVFSPGNATMHGVKARYDHLASQRTQLYGNLWYHQSPVVPGPEWEDFQIVNSKNKSHSVKSKIGSILPAEVKNFIKSNFMHRESKSDTNVISNRLEKNTSDKNI